MTTFLCLYVASWDSYAAMILMTVPKAGLYSGVLTAFLIESYRHLEPSSNAEMAFILREGFSRASNATDTIPPAPAFDPPLWAVRVNQLWFSSLICSLSTASFSMLVKQWLREYLLDESTIPQARLRARRYRRPALLRWRVLTIAGALPLILQISFGLFFLGLCFFTSAVNNQLSNTTTALVSAWALLVVMTILLPLFSPRCPYKIPLLKPAIDLGRKWLLRPPYKVLVSVINNLLNRTTPIKGNLIQAEEEEEDLIHREQDDDELLLSADKELSNDAILPVIGQAIRESKLDASKTIDLALQLANNRPVHPSYAVPLQKPFPVPDLGSLSGYAWDAITSIVADTLDDHRPELETTFPGWATDAIIILLSQSQYDLPIGPIQTLRRYFSDRASEDSLECPHIGPVLLKRICMQRNSERPPTASPTILFAVPMLSKSTSHHLTRGLASGFNKLRRRSGIQVCMKYQI